MTRKSAPHVSECVIPSNGYRELFLTFRPREKQNGSIESVEAFYERIAAYVASINGEIIQEHCFAPTSYYRDIALCRKNAYEAKGLTHEGTLCYIGEAACSDALLIAGVQLWVACGEDGSVVSPLTIKGRTVGVQFCSHSHCYTSFSCITPVPDAERNGELHDQAVSMFRHANRLLENQQLGYHDVVRTWIYIPELLSWYDTFNSARHQVFKEAEIMGDDHPFWLPASTGIQGGCASGDACMMGVLALTKLNGGEISVGMVDSPGQCEAVEYGSAFSRAVEVKDSCSSRVYVSGTASIDTTGKTVHIGNIKKQTQHTLDVIEDLLGAKGHGFQDVVHCVVFLKKPEFLGPYRKVAEKRGINLNCALETVADVCRDDLLIEIELLSVKSL